MPILNRLLCTVRTNPHGQRFISTIAVIGAGVMGSGIAQVAATAGNQVYVYDLTDPFLDGTRTTIQSSLTKIASEKFPDDKAKAAEFIKSTQARLHYTTDLKAAFDNTELVIEAIYENLEAKRRLFTKLENEGIADGKVIFGTNTLNLSIGDIAQSIKRKDKFAGVRFFFPVPRTKMMEITTTRDTTDKTISALTEWGRSLGKQPVVLVDAPEGSGIVNRLPQFQKAISMLERGDASVEEIDKAMQRSWSYTKGPLEVMDFIGLDIVVNTLDTLSKRYPNDPLYQVPSMLRTMVKDGKLGQKKGKGFYSYK